MLQFDVVLVAPLNPTGAYAVRFQNNIQCIFNRVRLLYGASPQEDLLQYGLLVRFLTETTSTGQNNNINQMSIADGIGGSATASILTAQTAGVTASAFSGTGTVGSITVTNTGMYVGQPVLLAGFQGPTPVDAELNGYYIVQSLNSTTGITINTTTTAITTLGTVTAEGAAFGLVNSRQAKIQGLEGGFTGNYAVSSLDNGWTQTNGTGAGIVPNNNVGLPGGLNTPAANYCVRRYMVNFALGVMTQDKLLPTKYMASQLAIEITLETPENCLYVPVGATAGWSSPPTYLVGNVTLIPEIIEFDDAYDNEFLAGLESGGVPLKFSTWNYFQFSTQGSSSLQLQVTERSRSVKGIIALLRRQTGLFAVDSHACLFDSTTQRGLVTGGSTMKQFQYRIGGRYFPAAPVELSLSGVNTCNGGAEAYSELAKFLNIVGDARLSTNITPMNWAVPARTHQAVNAWPEYDYSYAIAGYHKFGSPLMTLIEQATSAYCGDMPSSMFACAINFETSNGVEISGLNAEEQADISFNVSWSSSQSTGCQIEIFTFVDRMWVLRPNNYLDLIQ